MIELVLLGGGGHCESVIEIVNQLEQFKIIGVLDPSFQDKTIEENVLGIPIIGDDSKIQFHSSKGRQFIITVGQIESAEIRRKLYTQVKSMGGILPVIKAVSSYVSSKANIEEGTIIFNNVVVNCKTAIGKCAIINTGAIIEHGTKVGDFSHISTGAILNGEVSSGNNVFVGSGTVVNHGVNIGHDSIISSGSLVRKDVAPKSFMAGNPIRKIK